MKLKMTDNFLHTDITSIIIRTYYNVYNTLGYGFLEKVYIKALVIELKKLGLEVLTNQIIEVYYKGELIGTYIPDLIINNCVIVEVKACERLCYEHECQLVNYLKASHIQVGVLLNFGKTPEIKRKVFSKKSYKS